MAGAGPVELDEKSFESFVKANRVVLVDFWAPWCGPCRMVAPTVEELARELAGKVAFGKVNTDESPRIAQRFGIMSIPTLMIFKEGKQVDQLIGALPKKDISARLTKHLG